MIWISIIYLAFINLDALLLMLTDKRRAVRGGRRIPEATLFLVAVLGGSGGILLGMRFFHHKTLHTSFTVGMPLIAFSQVALVCVLAWMYINGQGFSI